MKRNASFDRRRAFQPDPPARVELRLVLEAQLAELRALLGSAIHLEIGTLPAAHSEVARNRRDEIVDLLRHLALDARDAMPAGGALEILVGGLQIGGAESARCAALVIREVRAGPAPRGAGRIHNGRGLGIGAACKVIENAGGHLLVSCRGREMVTTICFPPAP